jgi:predicted transcriptional regulator
MAIKAKKITIGIKTLEEGISEIAEAYESYQAGGSSKPHHGIYFENLDAFRKILTEKRLELLHVVKREKPDTIHQLARLVGRNVKNVSDDLKHLAELGLVTMDKRAVAGDQINAPRAPRVSYDKICLEIAI